MEFDVGARLKELRLAAGFSQRELASKAGVPHGLISMIEQNKSSPSVSSLRKIIGGFAMTLSDFFQENSPHPRQIFFRKVQLVDLTSRLVADRHSGSASIRMFQVGDAKKTNLQILYERYEPGADTGATMFQHESQEGGIVIAGMLELTVGDQVGLLAAGDGFMFDSRTPHRYKNVGDVVLEIVVANTPPWL
ncbi:cupin domain-containing protein [Tardiphaga sp.]|uniref:cupin domain-containing protein n=1 Tax=Tardiphaga sp. TaxID=1926292 RepID=UPI0025DFDEB8|nr:cupin domain-containing protein [Tardiphaga sp.]